MPSKELLEQCFSNYASKSITLGKLKIYQKIPVLSNWLNLTQCFAKPLYFYIGTKCLQSLRTTVPKHLCAFVSAKCVHYE